MNKKELLRTVKYVLIAASAGIIQFTSFTLMNEIIGWDYWISYLIALVLSVVWNFTFNRKYTFKSASNVPKAMGLVIAYYCVFTPLSTMLEHYLTRKCGWNEYLVTAINMLLNLATEFPYQRFVVFRKTIDTNDIAMKDREKELLKQASENAGPAAAEKEDLSGGEEE
ncbi:MAG: GtrA family protein [Clostridiales bacterium]|nr:GtrA family protein [Clostridiales bacterium]